MRTNEPSNKEDNEVSPVTITPFNVIVTDSKGNSSNVPFMLINEDGGYHENVKQRN